MNELQREEQWVGYSGLNLTSAHCLLFTHPYFKVHCPNYRARLERDSWHSASLSPRPSIRERCWMPACVRYMPDRSSRKGNSARKIKYIWYKTFSTPAPNQSHSADANHWNATSNINPSFSKGIHQISTLLCPVTYQLLHSHNKVIDICYNLHIFHSFFFKHTVRLNNAPNQLSPLKRLVIRLNKQIYLWFAGLIIANYIATKSYKP